MLYYYIQEQEHKVSAKREMASIRLSANALCGTIATTPITMPCGALNIDLFLRNMVFGPQLCDETLYQAVNTIGRQSECYNGYFHNFGL